MKVLVVGAGMYVTGRGTAGVGTVLAAIAQTSRHLPVEDVLVCATSADGAADVERATAEINRRLGTELRPRYALAKDVMQSASALREMDCAIVSVPDHLHCAIGRTLLEHDLHCLVVKPLAPTLAEGRALAELAADRGLHAAVELHKRFDEANLLVKRLLGERKLGRLSHVCVDYSQRIDMPLAFRKWAHRTNVFQYLGVHYVDLLYFLTGWRPTRAMAVGTRGILAARGIDTYDSVHALVEWADPGADGSTLLSQFATHWIDSSRSTAVSNQRFRIVGEHGSIDCDQTNRGVQVVTDAQGMEAVNPYFSQFLAGLDGQQRFAGYGFQSIERFLVDVAAIQAGSVEAATLHGARPTFTEGLVSTAVIDAVSESLASHSRWKDVDAALR